MIITETVFDNGLQLIYQPRTNPITSISLFCYVGSNNEPLKLHGKHNLNGISHLIEHMMFKGTKHISDTTGIAKIFDSVGAYFNAYTDKNVTCYTVKTDSEHIIKSIHTLADMVSYSTFKKTEFELEKKVVVEEIIRARDNTESYINNEIYSLVFQGNNLANSIGGEPEHILAYDYEQAKKYFETFYNPSNMVVSICSDVPLSTIKEIINSSYLITKPTTPINNTLYLDTTSLTAQTHIRSKAIDRKLEQTHIAIAFRTTDTYHEDIYALNILQTILAGNMSSRLFKSLRLEHGLTYNVGIDTSEYEKYGLFCILTSVDNKKLMDYNHDGVSKPGAISVIAETLKELLDSGITDSEVIKAKGYIKGHLTLNAENALNISDYNGKMILLNKPHIIPFHRLYELKYSSVTKKSINSVIAKYFTLDRMSLYLIGPNASVTLKESVKILSSIKS